MKPLLSWLVVKPLNKPFSNWLAWAQWLAVITMTMDHFVKFAIDTDDYLWVSDTFGRIAFPLFAGMLAWNWAFNTQNKPRYANRVLWIGLVAQIPYALTINSSVLNVCFTLGLALWSLNLMDRASNSSHRTQAALTIAMVVAPLVAGRWVEYGAIGFWYVIALGLYMRSWNKAFFNPNKIAHYGLLSLILGVLINNSNVASTFSMLTTAALLGIPFYHTALARIKPAAMPRRLRQAWYPAHIFAILIYRFF